MKFGLINSILICTLFSSLSHGKQLVDKIVASVSSDVVLLSELRGFEERIGKVGAIDETLLLGEPVSTLKGNKNNQLNYLIREKIIESEVKRLGLTMTESAVNSEIEQLSKQNKMSSTDFSIYLKSQGYTLAQYKNILKARIERQGLFEREIISKLRITDEDAYSVYQTKNPNYKSGVSEFKISQIFFSNKKGGATQSLARAEAAAKKLKDGEKFEKLANQVDETPGANPDGYLGEFKSGEFLPDIENAVVRMGEGEISGVLKGPNGFHIVKLISKKSVVDPNFLKVKNAIRANLVQQNFERQLKNWFELKFLDTNVKIYDQSIK